MNSKMLFYINVSLMLILGVVATYGIISFDDYQAAEGDSFWIVPGLCLLLILTFMSFVRVKWLSLALPFVLLGFPNIVNNAFGGVNIGTSDLDIVVPMITHIDIFLGILILFKGIQSGRLQLNSFSTWINLAVFLFIISTIVNILIYNDNQDTLLLLANTYPVRYCLLIQLFISNYKLNYRYIILGFIFCVLFLLVEALIYSHSLGIKFASGSLGINSFGNIISQVFIFFIFALYIKYSPKKDRTFIVLGALLCVIITLLSQTRMSIIATAIMMTAIIIPRLKLKNKILLVASLGIGLLILIKYFGFDEDKFNVDALLTNISYNHNSGGGLSAIDISRNATTTSLVTRLELWQISLEMFFSRPLIGIGYGTFNLARYNYGFTQSVIIDSHNGYLFLLSQLGVIGIMWIILLYIYPIKIFLSRKENLIKLMCIINMGMAICDLSNAGIFKNQIMAIMLFNVLLINNTIKNEKHTLIMSNEK